MYTYIWNAYYMYKRIFTYKLYMQMLRIYPIRRRYMPQWRHGLLLDGRARS